MATIDKDIVDKDIMVAMRDQLAELVGGDRFEVWFGEQTQLRLDRETLTVETSNAFTRDFLRANFRTQIESVCHKLVGPNIAIEFHVRESQATPTEKRSAAAKSNQTSPAKRARDTSRSAHDGPSGAPSHDPRPAASLNSFVVGEGNRLAYTSARMAVERPGRVSPLLVPGETGGGKTHLLENIRTAARAMDRRLHVVYLTAEQFTTLFLEALNGGGLPNFRRKYRGVDLLLIDDIQFFAGKKATLVELLHTIDTLQRAGRQIVLTADRPPVQLERLGPEVIARLTAGLVCPIEPADFATRRGVVAQLAARLDVDIPDDVQTLVATHLTGNARELAGALHRLQTTSLAHELPVTRTLAEKALTDLIANASRLVQLPDIQRAVCDVFGVTPEGLRSPRRTQSVSHPRMLAMWLARKHTRSGLSEIGEFFGRRSHSTVVSASKKVERWVSEQTSVALAENTCDVEEAIRRVEETLRTA